MADFTTTIVLDQRHLGSFRGSWTTWRDLRPQIVASPMIVAVSPEQSLVWWERRLGQFLDHPAARIVRLSSSGFDHRHQMLSGFLSVAAHYVETDYALRLDTDAVAVEPGDEWLTGLDDSPTLLAHRWHWTREAQWLSDLNAWWGARPSVNGPVALESDHRGRAKHPRLTAWLCFQRTDFLREIAAMRREPLLPIPSHSTFVWYCAHRLGREIVTRQFKQLGWQHGREAVAAVVEQHELRSSPSAQAGWPQATVVSKPNAVLTVKEFQMPIDIAQAIQKALG